MIEDQVKIIRDHIIELGRKGHFESVEINGAFTRGLEPPEIVGGFHATLTTFKFMVRAGYEQSEELKFLIEKCHIHTPFNFGCMKLLSTELFVNYGVRDNDWSFCFDVIDWIGDDGETD